MSAQDVSSRHDASAPKGPARTVRTHGPLRDLSGMDVARFGDYCQEAVPSATSSYADPRAHALRDRYVRVFGGVEIPVPVESIAEDLRDGLARRNSESTTVSSK